MFLITMNEQYLKLLELLITRNSKNFLEIDVSKLNTLREMFLKLSDPKIPSHELHYRDLIQVLYLGAKMNDSDNAEFVALLTDVGKHMESVGYRQDILNLSEHMLRKSSLHGDNMEDTPFLVRGVVHSQLKPAEANYARQLEKYFITYGEFFNVKEKHVMASLEPLDEQGYTLRNPRLVKIVNNEVQTLPTTYSKTFPFLRPERMNLDDVMEEIQTSRAKGQTSMPFLFVLFQGPDGLGYVFASSENSHASAYHNFLATIQEMGINSSKYIHKGGSRFLAETILGKAPHFSVVKHDAPLVQLDENLLAKTLNQMQMLEPGRFAWSFSAPPPI
jgi:hypothetical protein